MSNRIEIIFLIVLSVLFVLNGCVTEEEGKIKSITIVGINQNNEEEAITFDNPFSVDVTNYIAEVEYEIEQDYIIAFTTWKQK